MTIFRDPYTILDVKSDPTDAEVRTAYRTRSRELHPDRQRDENGAKLTGQALKVAQDRFADVNWAYQQIKDEPSRTALAAKTRQRFADTPVEDDPSVRNLPERGNDVKAEVGITFAEAFTGVVKTVVVHARRRCSECGGSGAAPGHSSHQCPDCRGAGKHRIGELVTTCQKCQGWGQIIKVPCPAGCDRGMIESDRPLDIEIPPGMRSGGKLIHRGEGEPGWRQSGDAEIVVHVESHPFFERKEADLQITVPVRCSEAMLGDDVRIPSPAGGALKLTIPSGVQSGSKLRVLGEGFPHYRDPARRGDLYAVIQVIVPPNPSDEIKRLAVQLKTLEVDDPRARFFS